MNIKRNVGKFMVAKRIEPIWPDEKAEWCVSTKSGDVLGRIKWNVKWRQFEFVPRDGSAFTWDCLKAMSEFLADLNSERGMSAKVTP